MTRLRNGSTAAIGFAVAGQVADAGAYSGVPGALMRALADLGVRVLPLQAELPRPLQRTALNMLAVLLTRLEDVPSEGSAVERVRLGVRGNKPRVHAGPAMAALRSSAVRARLLGHGEVAMCVQFGSEYRLPARIRYVTYDDATVAQLSREYDYPWMAAVPANELQRMIGRQARIFSRAHRCCVTNHWAADSATADYGVPRERIIVTGQGAEPRPAGSDARDWSTPRFLFVGKDWQRKNGHQVLRAFAHVRAQRPDARLDVVGGHPRLDAPGVTGHGLLSQSDPVAQARLDDLFSSATCFVMPSLLEPSACVFAEALQAGIPSIGGTAGGSSTIVGDAGRMVDGRDERAVTAAMLELCDEHALASCAAAARARAPLFTWRAVGERVLRALAPPGLDVAEFAAGL